MLLAQGNGFQAALLAPTEILANQHFETISSLLKELPVRAALLTGSVKRSARTPLLADLKEGTIDFLIGTHALLEDEVKFSKLGLVVIDEQHRFGVAQRAKMRQKSELSPHVLVMTATPIPRTLAMTFYGDLDVSIIDELPPGRKPIQTIHRFESHRPQLYQFMREQIGLGRQIYIVYPLIEESETLDFKSLEDGYLNITEAFPIPEYQVSMVHGKMRPEDKDREMQRFIEGTTHIMVATTVIEVGVNVPNASVMIIESAQRFGLSQLHQLRGRVGRGAEKSYCVLMTDYELSKESKKRMDTMVETNDGFKISEVDLKLRGPGDLMGTQQSGALNLKIADLSKDQEMVVQAREEAIAIYSEDPRLGHHSRSQLRNRMIQVFKHKPHWDKIG
jgi:ATP-dependent DNA helicase RecG